MNNILLVFNSGSNFNIFILLFDMLENSVFHKLSNYLHYYVYNPPDPSTENKLILLSVKELLVSKFV